MKRCKVRKPLQANKATVDPQALPAWGGHGIGLASPSPLEGGALGAGGPKEATSLEQLFSMALATADKPYQLIFPLPQADRKCPAQMAPQSTAGGLPWWLEKVRVAGILQDAHPVCHWGAGSSTDLRHEQAQTQVPLRTWQARSAAHTPAHTQTHVYICSSPPHSQAQAHGFTPVPKLVRSDMLVCGQPPVVSIYQ